MYNKRTLPIQIFYKPTKYQCVRKTLTKNNIFIMNIIFVCLLLPVIVLGSGDSQDSLLCRQCGHEILYESDIRDVNIETPLALSSRNETILGLKNILVQLMENTEGDLYEIITSSQADALIIGDWLEENTWFPDYSWKIGICPHCGMQLGWVFDTFSDEDDKDYRIFMALILHRVIGSKFADSLLVVPKLYQG